MSSNYKRLGKNSLFVFAGNIGSKLLSFLMLPFYTQWLSVEDYGTIDLINVYVLLIISIATVSIGDAIFRFPKDLPKTNQSIYFSSGFFISFIGLIISLIIILVIKCNFTCSNVFFKYTYFIFALIVCTFYNSYIQQFVRSIDKITVYVFGGLVYTIFAIVFSVILIPSHQLEGFVFAQILSLCLSTIYMICHAKIFSYFAINRIDFITCKEMISYSFPLIPNASMWWIISSSNRFFMESSLGLEAIGIFAVSNKFPTLLATFFGVFFISWQISVLEEFNKPSFREFYNKILKLVSFFMIILSITLSLASYLLVKFMVDVKFIEAWKYIPLICLSVPLLAFSTLIGANFMAAKQTKFFFISSFWGGISILCLNYFLIPLWGLWGASIAIVLSHIVMLLLRSYYSSKYVVIDDIGFYICNFSILALITIIITVSSSLLVKAILILILIFFFFYKNQSIIKILSNFTINYAKKYLS